MHFIASSPSGKRTRPTRGSGVREMPSKPAAIRRAESMSRDPANAGALAFKRSGDPNMGNFGEATILKTFGEVPENLDEL
jgi:hypothetical protein